MSGSQKDRKVVVDRRPGGHRRKIFRRRKERKKGVLPALVEWYVIRWNINGFHFQFFRQFPRTADVIHMRMGQQDRDAVVIEFRRPVRNVAGVGAGVNDIERPAVVRPDQVTVGLSSPVGTVAIFMV